MATSSKRVFSWACFDFANSAWGTLVLTFVYNSYFTSTIAPDKTSGTVMWGNTVALASLAIAVLSPMLGAVADAYGLKKRLMIVSVAISCAATGLLYFPVEGDVALALVLFGTALVATELSIVFNNAFLVEVAPRERHGKVSNLAFAFGYVGGLICLGIALVGFIGFPVPADSGPSIRATNVLVACWFAVFSLPLFLWVKEHKPPAPTDSFGAIAKKSFARLSDTLHHLRDYKQLFWMLVARLFYNDGLVTVFSFGGIYATIEFGFTFTDLMVFGIVLNILSGIGSYAFSFIEDRIGSRMTIIISTLGLVVATVAVIIVHTKPQFWACAVVLGFFIGPNQSASRAYLSRLTPEEKANEFFGFFAFSGKATAFMGPLLYGQITGIFDSQRAGMSIVPVLMILGLVIMVWKTKDDRSVSLDCSCR